MQALAFTTELDSVNIMLGTIGESPISTLAADAEMVDVAVARQILREVSIQIQEEVWNFNTEISWTLSPDSNGYLYLPNGCIQVDIAKSSGNTTMSITARGQRVYDRINHTFIFSAPLKTDLVVLQSFDDMPEAARHYITIRAARVFQQRMVGADSLGTLTEKDEARARASLKKLDADNSKYNFLTGSWSVMRVLQR